VTTRAISLGFSGALRPAKSRLPQNRTRRIAVARQRNELTVVHYGADLQDARTTAIVKSSTFEAVRFIVPAGHKIPPHRLDGEITLFCTEGCVRLGHSHT
jgi:quercetin dioxygenase-like cupin family protein